MAACSIFPLDRRCRGIRRIKWALVDSSLLAGMTRSPTWSWAKEPLPSKLPSEVDVKPDTLRSICRRLVPEPRDSAPALLAVFELCWELCCDLDMRQSLLFCLERGVLHPDKLLSDRFSLEDDIVVCLCGSRLGGAGAESDGFLCEVP
jgi:hypothetical protein